MTGLVVTLLLGSALVIWGGPAARAAGLSLVFPGAGLLYIASPIGFVVTVLALLLAIVLWWGISAHWAIPLVWLGSAGASALFAGASRLFVADGTTWWWAIPVAYVLAAASVTVAVVRMERAYRRKLTAVPELNRYLAAAALPERVPDPNTPTDFDAELLGWVYDLALQPIDQFEGFDWGEQIHGPTCVRYQLNMLGYGLAVYAANQLPNCPQPVESALANLILKSTDLRVWSYWRTLNLIGNFDANPDPIVSDNIMLSAYVADQINLYEAATGSTRFDEPGSLTFVWKDGRTYEYDHHSIVDAVRRNFEANALGFFPCEPGWVFTACNTMGAQALKGHDTLHRTAHWPAIEPRWRDAVEVEMMTPDGNLPHIRSKLVGLSFDTGEVPGGEYLLTGTNGFADVAPDLATRAGLIGLRGVDERMSALRGADRRRRAAARHRPGTRAQHPHRHGRPAVGAPRRWRPCCRPPRPRPRRAASHGARLRHRRALARPTAARRRAEHGHPPPDALGQPAVHRGPRPARLRAARGAGAARRTVGSAPRHVGPLGGWPHARPGDAAARPRAGDGRADVRQPRPRQRLPTRGRRRHLPGRRRCRGAGVSRRHAARPVHAVLAPVGPS